MRITLSWLIVPAVIGGLLFAGYKFTIHEGHRDVLEMASELGYCVDDASCEKAAPEFATVIMDASAYRSVEQIEWCLGVDSWASTHVRKGAWVRDIAVWAMYKRCPPPN